MSHASNNGSRVCTGGVLLTALLALFVLEARPVAAQPAGTAFTYQGRLTDNGTAVTGPYDIQCVLYTAAVGGSQVGPIVTLNDVAIANGLFTVNLDFGAGAFAGGARFLEIGVRPGASTGAYTVLGARQDIKPAPHTVFAHVAPWTGITGVPAGFADGIDNDGGGDITGITVGTGLTGGGAAGAISIGIDFPALTLNHNHFGQTWNGSQPSGLLINNNSANGAALRGAANATTGTGVGLFGLSASSDGIGVDGSNVATDGPALGVRGMTTASYGRGVYGLALATAASNVGVMGEARAPFGRGVHGYATATFGNPYGVLGEAWGPNGNGVAGSVSGTGGVTAGVLGFTEASGGAGVRGQAQSTAGNNQGVDGISFSTTGVGVRGRAIATTGANVGVLGLTSSPVGIGVWGVQSATSGLAGYFQGNATVTGTLSKSAGSFKIDHPLDPENKYLYHSFVESPEMMNVYAGNVVTDGDGFATVELPDWFEALNRDFRYQLTVLDEGDSAVFVQAKVVRKIAGNRFTVRTSAPGVEVSWQVTGVRKDIYAEKHRIPVEEMKPDGERGRYIHPADWGLPPERGVNWPLLQSVQGPPPMVQED